MSLLKWKKAENDWVTLYGSVLKNRLRRDKNLADLTDATEAKKNLGLLGDVSDHNHDSRYMPMLQRVADDLSRETEARTTWETNFDQEIHASVEAQVENVIREYGASINAEAVKRDLADTKLKSLIQQNTDDFNDKFRDAEKTHTKILATAKGYVEDEHSQREAALQEEERNREDGDKAVQAVIDQKVIECKNDIAAEGVKRNEAIEKKASEIKSWIAEEANARKLAVSGEAGDREKAISAESKKLSDAVDMLQKADKAMDDKLTEKYETLRQYIEKLIGKFYIGTVQPSNPVNNQSIWFYTAKGEESIRVFKDNKWVTFGASYL